MSTPKWYKVKCKNFTGISEQDFWPSHMKVDESQTHMAKGPIDHCNQIKNRLEELNYPGDLYIEECQYDGKLFPLSEEEQAESDRLDMELFQQWERGEKARLTKSNKELIKKTQQIMSKLGYEIKTGHLYELYSQLIGYKSYNVAKTKNPDFEQVIPDTEV